MRAAVALWPTFSGRHVRDYIGRTFAAGVVDRFSVQVRMDREAIRRARERLPMTAQELAFEVVMSGAEWRATPDMPPLRADASASGDGASARILVAGGRMTPGDGPALAISNGVVRIDSARRPAMADISFSVAGDLPALLRVMDSAGLGAAPVEPARVRGAARLDVSLKTPLSGSVTAASLQPQAHGALSDVRVARAVGEHDLEGGSFRVDIGAAAAHVAGEARIGGAMVGLDVREARSGAAAGETTVTAVLDDAARARLGFGAGADFSGPVSVVLRFAPEAKASPRVEIDLAKLRISNPVPGWSKAAGRPGRLAFRLDQREGTTRLSDMALEAGNLSASGGSAEIDAKGLQRLRFDVFRMSASDSMRLEAERDGDGYRVTARGRLLDARPALRALLAGEGGAGRGGRAGATASGPGRARIDLDLSAAIVAGFNNEALTNVSLRLTARDGEVRQATVSGSFGAATASLKLAPQRDGETLDVRSGNAGALLRFADIYRRMYGGDVIISAQLGRRAQGGSIDIARFTLRNEPALARIVASQPGRADGINVSEAPFNRLQGTFLRQGGRVQLRDGVIWGPQVGITLAGVVDFARDSTDLAGTFIPAYSVNNAFARIPLLGPLIGGGAREGMFAVSFRITGPASAPTLTVNPLTAVAPGILRKFLEVFTPDGSSRNPAPARPER
ncbi:AsmA-like C-terminal region-containing protein [Camelimonas abortus]|uniref:AsmA-like C-terminal region-containing protein n=1 Tax=Camelimonas abortus TaxID=1017184 RepID=A0ABV7LGK8_9HYPH